MNEEVESNFELADSAITSCAINIIITCHRYVGSHLFTSIGGYPIFANTPLQRILQMADGKRVEGFTELVCVTASTGVRYSFLEFDNLRFGILGDLSYKEIKGGKYHYEIFFAYRRPFIHRTLGESTYEVQKFLAWISAGNTDVKSYSTGNQNFCYHFFKPVK